MKTVAVILSGCGVFDGSEIHEAVLTLLALDRANARVVCAAPDIAQHHVTNHSTKQVVAGEKRNVLVESARIARGNIKSLRELKPDEYQAVILPGGFGAAHNLCNFAEKGAQCQVNPDVAKTLQDAHRAGKPLGFICIAPAIAASLFGAAKVELTIGNDAGTAHAIEACGAKHIACTVHNFVADRRLKIVSTPAYMLGTRITEVEAGINKLVQAVLEMA
jgi:enhancing lycopene biosynthesis protein 2